MALVKSLLLAALAAQLVSAQLKSAIQGTHCSKNQVVNKVTFYEDGAIEAECGPIPCGASGASCIEDQAACRDDTPLVFSGMKWAPNGQSLLLRCCSLDVGNKMYVGTDMITLGAFYSGGLVSPKDKFGHGGAEFDYVSSIRAEQGGIRIWVHRIMCASDSTTPEPRQQLAPARRQQIPVEGSASSRSSAAFEQRRQNLLRQLNSDAPVQHAAPLQQAVESEIVNPLKYRPRQHDAPLVEEASARLL